MKNKIIIFATILVLAASITLLFNKSAARTLSVNLMPSATPTPTPTQPDAIITYADTDGTTIYSTRVRTLNSNGNWKEEKSFPDPDFVPTEPATDPATITQTIIGIAGDGVYRVYDDDEEMDFLSTYNFNNVATADLTGDSLYNGTTTILGYTNYSVGETGSKKFYSPALNAWMKLEVQGTDRAIIATNVSFESVPTVTKPEYPVTDYSAYVDYVNALLDAEEIDQNEADTMLSIIPTQYRSMNQTPAACLTNKAE